MFQRSICHKEYQAHATIHYCPLLSLECLPFVPSKLNLLHTDGPSTVSKMINYGKTGDDKSLLTQTLDITFYLAIIVSLFLNSTSGKGLNIAKSSIEGPRLDFRQ